MSETPPFKAVILAAGLGTRMKSALPKVMHRVLGWPMVAFPIEVALGAGAEEVCVVIGHGRELVEGELERRYGAGNDTVTTAVQEQMLGTADAVRSAWAAFADYDGAVMILSGDVPNLPAEVVEQVVAAHAAGDSPVTLLTAHDHTPNQYGRIVRGEDGGVVRIVEFKDADDAQRAITEVNIGTYLVDAPFLREGLSAVASDNAAGEFYLTDLIGMAADAGRPANGVVAADIDVLHGVNDRSHLARATEVARARRNAEIMRTGVTMHAPETVSVDMDASIGRDVTIEPNVVILGRTTIGDGATIEAFTRLEDAEVAAGAVVRSHSRVGGA